MGTTEEANVLKDKKQAQGDEDLNNSKNVDTKAETTGSIDNDNKDRSSSESDFVMVEKEDLAPLKEAHEEKKESDGEPMLSKEVDPLELQEAAENDCKENETSEVKPETPASVEDVQPEEPLLVQKETEADLESTETTEQNAS